MQIEIDVKCMHTNFGGRVLSSFGDIATSKNGQISLSTHVQLKNIMYSPWWSKKLNQIESAQNIHASRS